MGLRHPVARESVCAFGPIYVNTCTVYVHLLVYVYEIYNSIHIYMCIWSILGIHSLFTSI